MSTGAAIEDTLLTWYRRYVGQPDQRRDIYLGFGLFFAGIAFGIVGLVLFLGEGALSGPEKLYWIREIAFAVGAMGLPVTLLGVVVLLPGDDRVRYVGIAGTAITLLAVAVFVTAYPYNWDVGRQADYSIHGTALYAVGLVTVLGATGSTLVGYHVERATPAAADSGAEEEDDEPARPSVSDEQVERDIEEAMQETEISWGGIQKSETRRITVETEDAEIDTSGFEGVQAKTVRSTGNVDDAVSNLQGLKGGTERTDRSSSGVDDQAAALKQLRAEKMATESDSESALNRPEGGGLLSRLRGLLPGR
jgi:hypothetical protein